MIRGTGVLTAVVAALGLAVGVLISGGLIAVGRSYLHLTREKKRLAFGLIELKRVVAESPLREPYRLLLFLRESEIGAGSLDALVADPRLAEDLLDLIGRGRPPPPLRER